MEFLHTDFWGGSESVAVVTVDARCNVLLLSDLDFAAYRRGGAFGYHGGWATQSPVRLVPPHHGHWHLVVDLGGGAGQVRAQVRIAKAAPVQ
ncbi:MAG: DUF1883 domain-containing protein [Armatimonadetes bacterium]|nr:DUF1883 domain-containing protein [Armatimonadota bacterium]